ncbi:MAG: FAD:protein FMN transferase [Winogradskyella sp.]|uniref:FAD:protein FMN transferase n=1 Tax=Winogradskyella sp. TaxID=1883156 RepID=UPI001810EA24|nr:FAD:protein FMN transferase [Winogradskyella sp.]MBT8246062.1 FAD:protein FMN transferase [Winogradskyella sp.]NNK22940.1 FAD:protein FMN transferase [Winogradskyella sp.]
MKKITLLFFALVTILACKEDVETTIKLNGPVFGTGYNIQYYSEEGINYQKEFDSLFTVINNSLSTYISSSDISKWNRNEPVEIDEHFTTVFNTSKKIFKESKGLFDPTIGNVVNAWNFGPDENKFLTDSTTIKSLMQHVGFDRVIKTPTRFIRPDSAYLDFNAIAKGYGIDVIGEFLESRSIRNYIVDIGGDIRASGINKEKKKGWTIGIEDPNFDGSQSYSKAITLTNKGMATSGTYRKFKVDEEGNRYAHIINTTTGYPTKTNVLSVSVIAPNAMLADGYATTFQTMGLEKTKVFLNAHPELQVYFIYLDESGALQTLSLNGFPE